MVVEEKKRKKQKNDSRTFSIISEIFVLLLIVLFNHFYVVRNFINRILKKFFWINWLLIIDFLLMNYTLCNIFYITYYQGPRDWLMVKFIMFQEIIFYYSMDIVQQRNYTLLKYYIIHNVHNINICISWNYRNSLWDFFLYVFF